VINGENRIVVNSKATKRVKAIWALWNAQDRFFSARLKHSDARSQNGATAAGPIAVIFGPDSIRPSAG
jgi:hypothetical protein